MQRVYGTSDRAVVCACVLIDAKVSGFVWQWKGELGHWADVKRLWGKQLRHCVYSRCFH